MARDSQRNNSRRRAASKPAKGREISQGPGDSGSLRGRLFSRAMALAESAQALPGADRVLERVDRAEKFVLGELKSRLAQVEGHAEPTDDPPPRTTTVAAFDVTPSGLPERLQAFMERSEQQSEQAARHELFHHLLDQLTADEVRLIGALSDGDVRPLVHVGVGPLIGPVSRTLSENHSDIGKRALINLLECTPIYIARLRQLGLLAVGKERRDLDVKYQIIEGERDIMQTLRRIDAENLGRARLIRESIYLSDLGRALWAACQPGGVSEQAQGQAHSQDATQTGARHALTKQHEQT